MNGRLGRIIQKQKELIAEFEKQCAADQQLINSQKESIMALEEKTALLEKEKQALIDAGDELSAANEKLEENVWSSRNCSSLFPGFYRNSEDSFVIRYQKAEEDCINASFF